MSSLSGKVLCILGGSGYVGSNIAQFAVNHGAQVVCINRSGRPQESQPFYDKLEWVKGDSMNPESFGEHLAKADAVIHTIGTLVDSSILKGRNPGEPGTYEHLNRDTALAVGKFLNDLKQNKKIVYVSASKAPPFVDRYLTTKEEAEEFLLSQSSLRTVILKPGFIYSFNERPWSLPLQYNVDLYHQLYSCFNSQVPNESLMKKIVKQFDVDSSVALQDLVVASVSSAFTEKHNSKQLYNSHMEAIGKQFDLKGVL